jgi:hypothetical protein
VLTSITNCRSRIQIQSIQILQYGTIRAIEDDDDDMDAYPAHARIYLVKSTRPKQTLRLLASRPDSRRTAKRIWLLLVGLVALGGLVKCVVEFGRRDYLAAGMEMAGLIATFCSGWYCRRPSQRAVTLEKERPRTCRVLPFELAKRNGHVWGTLTSRPGRVGEWSRL